MRGWFDPGRLTPLIRAGLVSQEETDKLLARRTEFLAGDPFIVFVFLMAGGRKPREPEGALGDSSDHDRPTTVSARTRRDRMTRMRAAVLDRYGPPEVLRIEDVEPPAPARGEVLVRVHAATVNRNDCAWRRGSPFVQRAVSGWRRPKANVLGSEFAGTVIEVGTEVSRFASGDEVFGVRAYLTEGFGAQAEYLAVAATSAIAHKPANVSFEHAAAACDGALSALPFLRKASVGPGSTVLVYGASGAIGSAAVQLARHMGAEVTAFAGARSLELVRSLGAVEAFDYREHDPASIGRRYDMVFDAVGKLSHLNVRRLLTERGVFASTGGLLNFVMVPLTARSPGRRVIFAPPAFSRPNVEFLADLMASDSYRPVIDRVYPLDEVVEANRYVETERKTGNVVLGIGT